MDPYVVTARRNLRKQFKQEPTVAKKAVKTLIKLYRKESKFDLQKHLEQLRIQSLAREQLKDLLDVVEFNLERIDEKKLGKKDLDTRIIMLADSIAVSERWIATYLRI